MATNTEIYGRGFAFPFAFDPLTGGVKKQLGIPLVEDDLVFILGTYPGERFMAPTFGSRIGAFLFELYTEERKTLLRSYIADASLQEPRVERISHIDIKDDPSQENGVLVELQYRLIHQMDERNLVLPLVRG